MDAIRVLRPQLAVFENVPGHIGLGLDTVLADLASCGWDAQWATLRASDVGAPHSRERLFIVASNSCGERLQASGLTRRPAEEITGDHDLHEFLAGINRAPDIDHELSLRFGEYADRILSWAIITRRPPPPLIADHVTAGVHPRFPEHRAATSPAFIEWLMGLPEGWVTEVPGVSTREQLKILGNGVVPAQASTAIHQLISERTPA